MKKLSEIFHITYWTKLDFNKMDICEDLFSEGINFISRTSQNNWVVAKVKKIEDKKPLKKWQITVSLWGSYVLSAFLQTEDFYTAQNVAVLDPIEELSERELFYYCMCITKNRFRYWAFWREANVTLKDLLVPNKEDFPKWIYTVQISDYKYMKESVITDIKPLQFTSWQTFKYSDIFCLEKWYYNNRPEEDSDWIPFISATENNNWITDHVQKEWTKIFKWNCISITNDGSIWNAFYQEQDFTCSHSVNILKLHEKFSYSMNKYLAFFLIPIIQFEKFRYAYWFKRRIERMKESSIKLPADKEWNPDWKFMEEYIKSLPYSKSL